MLQSIFGRAVGACVAGASTVALAACAGSTGSAGVSCASEVTYDRVTYVSERIVNAEPRDSAEMRRDGIRQLEVWGPNCPDPDSREQFTATAVPGVPVDQALLVDDGYLSLYVRHDLIDQRDRWTTQLRSYTDSHPAANDL